MNLNNVTFAGRVTREIELSYTPKGTAVAEVGIASNRRIKKNDEWVNEPTFIDVTLWGRNAENVSEYFTKGDAIYITGRLQVDSWVDKDTGKKRSKLRVVGEQWQFVGSASSGGSRNADRPRQAAQESQRQAAESRAGGGQPAGAVLGDDDGDDDIPF